MPPYFDHKLEKLCYLLNVLCNSLHSFYGTNIGAQPYESQLQTKVTLQLHQVF